MRIAEICPVFKGNYRPISALSNLLNFSKSSFFLHLNSYMQNKFSKYFAGFWENHNMQISLIRMIESWKVRLNNGSKVEAKIMALSKAFGSKNSGIWFR